MNWRVPQWFEGSDTSKMKALELFHVELVRYNEKVNLISKRTVEEADLLHFADCIMAAGYILQETSNDVIYDIGSGNGLPGIILAILDSNRKILLVESDERKAEFLKHLIYVLRLENALVKNMRAEELHDNSIDFAVSRAFASLKDATAMTLKAMAPESKYYHLKSKTWRKEEKEFLLEYPWKKAEIFGEYSLPEKVVGEQTLRKNTVVVVNN